MRHFFSVHDVPDINQLIQKAVAYKQNPLKDEDLGRGKRMGLLFLNPSLRTRLSSQIAAKNLGMEPIIFNLNHEGWQLELEEGAIMNGRTVEHVKDAAMVLGEFFDILCVRGFASLTHAEEDDAERLFHALKHYSGIPVVSLESATLHPLQSLADVQTIHEHRQHTRRPKVVLTWTPHVKALPQAVANSFAQWMTQWDIADFVIAQPEGFELKEDFTQGARITHHQEEALEGADFIYMKNWSSYYDYGKVKTDGQDWMLTKEKLRRSPEAKVMHCLPVRRNVVVSDEVLDSPASLIKEQAGNRVWAAQAVFAEILKTSKASL